MKKVTVIGAGMIGICCALEAQRLGFAVTLIDRDAPAEGASYGNAGVLSTSGIAPYASPEILKLLPMFGLNLDPRFRFHWPHVFAMAPWLLRFIKNCNTSAYRHGLQSLSYISKDAVELHRGLLKQCNKESILVEGGWIRLYRSQSGFDSLAQERDNYDKFSVPYEVIDGPAISDLEPDIKRQYAKAIYLTGSPSVTNPKKLCLAYFELFKSMGGEFIQTAACEIHKSDSAWFIKTSDTTLHCDNLVVAMGAQSSGLLKPVGIHIPMIIERGYHLAYSPQPEKKLTHSIIDIETGLVMTPMDFGIRVTSAVNLIAYETKPTFKQILDLVPQMRSMFPIGEPLMDTPWVGHRPSMPDSIPVIGKAPGIDNLWLAFGHGHLGLTLGPKTGLLIASAMAGKKLDNEAEAFSPGRFS